MSKRRNRGFLFISTCVLIVSILLSVTCGSSAQDAEKQSSGQVTSKDKDVSPPFESTAPATNQEKETSSQKTGGSMSNIYRNLAQTGLVIIVGYLVLFLAIRLINRQIADLKLRHLVRKYVIYLLNLAIIALVVFVWLRSISYLTIFVSVIGAGVALALQESILCMAGWILILIKRPFVVGDRVEFGGIKGDVIDIRLFHTALLEIGNWVEADQSTGRTVDVPNSAIFKRETHNYTRGFEFIWNEIKVTVTFESDWRRAEQIMLNHANEHARGMEDLVKQRINNMAKRYMIYFSKLTPIVYVRIKEYGVELSLRYLTEARKRRSSEDVLSRNILDDFAKESNVDFAYPTYRIVGVGTGENDS